MSRGIIYITWSGKKGVQPRSDDKIKNALNLSISSAERFGIPYKIFSVPEGSYHTKVEMLDKSPFDTTLFLDVDTVILKNPEFGFEAAEKFHIAAAHAPAVYALLHWKLQNKINLPNLIPQYNVGVIFFNKSDFARAFFKKWRKWINITKKFTDICDQNTFAMAAWDSDRPIFALPVNWNWRHLYRRNNVYGPIMIYHGYGGPPKWIDEHNKGRARFRT